LKKIEAMLDGIGKFVSGSDGFDQGYKSRLLNRLNKLKDDSYKKVGDLDQFWGLIGEAGIARSTLGRDAKPVVDRIRQIVEIIWRTQARAEELPSGIEIPSVWKKDV
jgi:uncharacterized protein YoxC